MRIKKWLKVGKDNALSGNTASGRTGSSIGREKERERSFVDNQEVTEGREPKRESLHSEPDTEENGLLLRGGGESDLPLVCKLRLDLSEVDP